ncbi:MAG: outer membrane protein transport protein [Proteobacteria bacterium]|nr:outer membrane protein transport protein [Pseudomonadota bacterium]
MNIKHALRFIPAILVLLISPCTLFGANGYFIHGAGAVNESLGGAATAGNGSDLLGSLYRNPANATLFGDKAFSVSLEMLIPDLTVKSSVGILGLNDSSDSDVDMIPSANMGMVLRNKNLPAAFYFGVIAEAGLHLDISESTTNPVFIAQQGKANNPFGGLFGGFGAVETQLEVIRIPLGISYDYNDKWSAGFSLAPSIARMMFTPAAFAAPDDANADGIPTYPDDIDHDVSFGFGFQAGVRYKVTDDMNIGFTLTSPTWFEKFEWKTKDEAGQSRKVSFHLDRPLSLHVGANYRLPCETLLLMDVSWINYADTKGFDKTGFASDGSLKGLGFDDIYVVALGVQQTVQEKLTLRAGYNYCTNPIDEDITFFNVGSPLHNQHHLSIGASWAVTKQAAIDFGYTHAFKSSQSGPMYTLAGKAPGTKVESEMAYEQIAVGVTVSY